MTAAGAHLSFESLVLLTSCAALAATLSSRATERLRIPAPALFLAVAAVASQIWDLEPGAEFIEQSVSVALVLILFDGGLHIGLRRLAGALRPVVVVGVLGTFLTAAAIAAVGHLVLGLSWYLCLLLGTAIAPTDPALVFSVLGKREIRGHSSTVLEAESGANDPVGIALMASLVAAGGLTAQAAGSVVSEFLLQMGVGVVVGLAAVQVLRFLIAHVALSDEGLYPLRSVATAFATFAISTALGGSGFLAVFIAGIGVADLEGPFHRETRRFHAALASLGELVAFVVLGLTVDLSVLTRADVWVPGLVIFVLLTAVVRPVVVFACLAGSPLSRAERLFVQFAGLKGAVPVLLGTFILHAEVPAAARLYGIVVIVVTLSVVVQGGLVPLMVRWLRLPAGVKAIQPWVAGVRLEAPPENLLTCYVRRDAPVAGMSVGELTRAEGLWVSLAVRRGVLVPLTAETRLEVGDELLMLVSADRQDELAGRLGLADEAH